VSKSAPRVVLLGKGKSDHTDEMSTLISQLAETDNLNTENIPAQFLAGVFITTTSGKKYQIDPQLYNDIGLNYSKVEDYLKTLKFDADDNADLIEVVIDFDKTKKILSSNVKSLTDIFEAD